MIFLVILRKEPCSCKRTKHTMNDVEYMCHTFILWRAFVLQNMGFTPRSCYHYTLEEDQELLSSQEVNNNLLSPSLLSLWSLSIRHNLHDSYYACPYPNLLNLFILITCLWPYPFDYPVLIFSLGE